MNDLNSIEDRLRRAFHAAAEQSVAERPVAEGSTEMELPATPRPARRHVPRRLGLLGVAFVALVSIAIALTVAYGPFPSSNRSTPTSVGGAGAKSRLQNALDATLNASSYLSTNSSSPGDTTIVNAPDLIETIEGGRVSEIDVGKVQYIASWAFALRMGYHYGPTHCGPHALYIEIVPQGSFSANYDFKGATVVEKGDLFTVTRDGSVTETFLVRNGEVVSITSRFPSIGKSETTDFSEIGTGPKIPVPSPNEVVVSPKAFFRGCPIANLS